MFKQLIILAIVIVGWVYWLDSRPTTNSSNKVDSDHPSEFRATDTAFRHLKIETVYSISRENNWIETEWPFNPDWVLIACAKPAMNIVKVGTAYAALNGNTSSQVSRYEIQEKDGRRTAFHTTRSNHELRSSGVVKSDATDMQIGTWWSAMNSTLLKTCDR
jgi:hypothetical protein